MTNETIASPIRLLLHYTKNAIDWFVPTALRTGDEENLRRARTIVALSWLFVPMVPIAWTLYSWLGWEHLFGPVMWWGAITFLSPFLLRITGSTGVAASVSLFHYCSTILMISVFTGGWDSPVLWWVVPVPFVAGSITCGRGAFFWTLIAVLILGAQWWLTPMGWVVELPENARNIRINNLTTMLSMLGVLLSAFLYTESLRLAAMSKLTKANLAMRSARDDARTSLQRVATAKKRADAALVCAERSAADLAESNRVKSELLRMTAHDLRGPLSVMTGLAQLALEGDCSEFPPEKSLELILNSADNMRGLLESLLDLNKIETGQLKPQFSLFDTEMVCEELLGDFFARAKAKNIELKCLAPTTAVQLKTDVTMLRQILQNLLSNAIKYSAHGSHVHFEIHASEAEVEFVVRDAGQGMSPNDLTQLYKPFARMSSVPTGDESSVGVGLSIVKGLVDILDGHILCQSQLGHGTTFRVLLPLGEPAAHPSQSGEFALMA